MKNIIISELNNVNFFLNGRIEVKTLQEGALLYGGATEINNKIYSNIETNSTVIEPLKDNTLSVFIPSTLEVNSNIDNSIYVQYYKNIVEKEFKTKCKIDTARGSWFSEDNKEVVLEDITILSFNKSIIDKNIVNKLLSIGLMVKKDMRQEGVSCNVNNTLLIV